MQNLEAKIKLLKQYILEAKNITIFSGAGLSVPSGIPDFRSSDGLYSSLYKETLRPEEIISHSFFMADPKTFYEFYFQKMVYKNAKPNKAHLYFSKLQATKNIKVVTQNIDGLDIKAGLKNVYEIHGSIWHNHCMKCHKYYSLNELKLDGIPRCSCGGIIKPDVTLYEESLDNEVINQAIKAIQDADLLLVIGTSLVVYPAASFINFYHKDKLVIINKTKTPGDNLANLVINDDIINVVSMLDE